MLYSLIYSSHALYVSDVSFTSNVYSQAFPLFTHLSGALSVELTYFVFPCESYPCTIISGSISTGISPSHTFVTVKLPALETFSTVNTFVSNEFPSTLNCPPAISTFHFVTSPSEYPVGAESSSKSYTPSSTSNSASPFASDVTVKSTSSPERACPYKLNFAPCKTEPFALFTFFTKNDCFLLSFTIYAPVSLSFSSNPNICTPSEVTVTFKLLIAMSYPSFGLVSARV